MEGGEEGREKKPMPTAIVTLLVACSLGPPPAARIADQRACLLPVEKC